MTEPKIITVALVDDHTIFREGVTTLLKEFGDIKVSFDARNGEEMKKIWPISNPPEVVLMDINMPVMDGYDSLLWIRQYYPLTKVLILSMYEDDINVIKMLRAGACGYVLKESKAEELIKGIRTVIMSGYFINETVSGRLINSLKDKSEKSPKGLSAREQEFLKLCCSELTYKEIAGRMHVSPRTVDGYRDELFEKLDIHSRTGLVIYSIKNKLYQID